MISNNSKNSINSHLRKANDRYHMIICYKDKEGTWRQISKSTGLYARGNKKRAEKFFEIIPNKLGSP